MPWAMALRVVSLPATDSSMKNRLKSISDSGVAVDLGVQQRGHDVVAAGSARRCSASCLRVHEHLDLGF